jgi:hypothetical protein
MCFEWDKRYFRELEEKRAKEKLDEMLKKAEEAVTQPSPQNEVKTPVRDEEALN